MSVDNLLVEIAGLSRTEQFMLMLVVVLGLVVAWEVIRAVLGWVSR